jgi:hypothetical protein
MLKSGGSHCRRLTWGTWRVSGRPCSQDSSRGGARRAWMTSFDRHVQALALRLTCIAGFLYPRSGFLRIGTPREPQYCCKCGAAGFHSPSEIRPCHSTELRHRRPGPKRSFPHSLIPVAPLPNALAILALHWAPYSRPILPSRLTLIRGRGRRTSRGIPASSQCRHALAKPSNERGRSSRNAPTAACHWLRLGKG